MAVMGRRAAVSHAVTGWIGQHPQASDFHISGMFKQSLTWYILLISFLIIKVKRFLLLATSLGMLSSRQAEERTHMTAGRAQRN